MRIEQIKHNAYFKDCYPLNDKELRISITTGKDIDSVALYAGDPFLAGISENELKWAGQEVEMSVRYELQNSYVWSCIIEPEYKRAKYHFKISSKDETLFYMEDGFYTDIDNISEKEMIQRFIFPWINPSDVCVEPKWVKNTIWYQIFPDRFNKALSEKTHTIDKWEEKTDESWNVFYGGDLKGITDKLEYIAGMGFNGIYINPVMSSDSNHRYNTFDYYLIDTDLGTEADMIELVKQAHRLNIKVMIDAVFNHCGRKWDKWMDVVAKGPESEYFDWFYVNKWPFEEKSHLSRNNAYYSFAFVDDMPKLNTDNPKVMDYLTKVAKHWITDWNIDGIRYDVGNEISHTFIKYMRKELKACQNDVFLLGEIWHDAGPWLLGDEYDSVMSYPFLQTVNNFWANEKKTSDDFRYEMNRCCNMYFDQINSAIFNLLDSHDTERLYSRCDGDENKFWQQLVVLLTMKGSPSIYYGTETLMQGVGSKENRKCMPWDKIKSGAYDDTINTLRTLIDIRKKYIDDIQKDIVWTASDNRIIRYRLGRMIVIINADIKDCEIKCNNILFERNYSNGVLMAGGVIIGEG